MENKPKFKPDPKLKLMEQVRQVLRYHHYAYRTEQTYCDWIVRFIKFHGSQTHPAQMGKEQIDAFLSHLATQGQVSASTQRQALNAIIFLHRHVLDQPIEDRLEPVKAKRHARPPTVMTQSEIYTHVMEKDISAVSSPLDRLLKTDTREPISSYHRIYNGKSITQTVSKWLLFDSGVLYL